ncbi:MAG TPA: phosphotransferase [Acetobacteraceae bacterium]|nr:phosphotransferase [Acetobacteraceae bacterium]
MAELIDILPQHRVDEAALAGYLREKIAGLTLPLNIRQFQGGQSNPTFQLTDAGGARYVLRKKPPGAILPSAHAVEREYAAMHALGSTGVPVPKMRLLCEDSAIIGTPFYVMDFIEGRVLTNIRVPELDPAERRSTYFAMVDGLAALHRVDWRAAGLGDFGKPENYVARQIARWTKQYLASHPEPNADMEGLMRWLPENVPAEDPPTIAHGDYRLGNLIFAPDEPKLLAILDWELATIGQPLGDLGYLCSFYHLPAQEGAPFRGLGGLDLVTLGIPTETELIQRYCAQADRPYPPPNFNVYLAFSMFRSAAIGQGVYDRSQRGNAADSRAHLYMDMVRTCARVGWQVAQGG